LESSSSKLRRRFTSAAIGRRTCSTLRLPDGRLLIPSSTWKGALQGPRGEARATLPLSGLEKLAVERVMPAQSSDEARRRVREGGLLNEFRAALSGKQTANFDPADVREKLISVGYDLERIEDEEWALVTYLSLYCPVGRLFGNWARAGSLRFFDTVLPASTQRRPGVGINRKAGTVQENVLYFVETSEAGLRVPLIIVGEVEERGRTPARLLSSSSRRSRRWASTWEAQERWPRSPARGESEVPRLRDRLAPATRAASSSLTPSKRPQ